MELLEMQLPASAEPISLRVHMTLQAPNVHDVNSVRLLCSMYSVGTEVLRVAVRRLL